MNLLVTGGSASGKSQYAEAAAARLGGPLFYLATMRPWDHEGRRRIEKHRRQRAGKGFETIECYDDLRSLTLPARGTVLLECMGNLTANVLYGEAPPENPRDAIWDGLCHLMAQCANLVVVSNAVGADGVRYDEENTRYLEILAEVEARMGCAFDAVTEVVCGIALAVKGELL